MSTALNDLNSAMQVLGSLIKNPLLLAENKKYILREKDFNTSLTKIIFVAINNLFIKNKLEELSIIDIDNYLQQNNFIYDKFKKENGLQFLKDIIEISNPNNFDYYYNRLKKISALNMLKQQGFNIKSIYDEEELDIVKQQKQLKNLDEIKIEQIFEFYNKQLTDIKYNYVVSDDSELGTAADNIENLFEELQENPEIGIQLQGDIYNTVTRGARLKKFYLISGSTGSGKSRQLTGHACNIAFPERYDLERKKWIKRGEGEKILFFGTEMEKEEVQTLILAHLSGVNEEQILNNRYDSPEQKERIYTAIKVMKKYQDNFIWVREGDPSINQIKTIITKQVLKYNIKYVFYDYIFSSPGLLSEFKDFNLREDVVLTMLSTALKDLANDLGIFIMSATQLNGNWQDFKGIRNQNLIRGSKGIVDKIDIGGISLPVTEEEHKLIDKISHEKGIDIPNQVQDIYKVRRGRYNHVRIWSRVDLGTCRTTDLFITDVKGNEINMTINKYLLEEDEINTVVNEDLSKLKKEETRERNKSKSFEGLI